MIGYTAVKGSSQYNNQTWRLFRTSQPSNESSPPPPAPGPWWHRGPTPTDIFTNIIKKKDSGGVCRWEMWRIRRRGRMRRRDSLASPNDSSVQHLYHLLFRVPLLQHTQAASKHFCNETGKVGRSYRDERTLPGTASPSHCGGYQTGSTHTCVKGRPYLFKSSLLKQAETGKRTFCRPLQKP